MQVYAGKKIPEPRACSEECTNYKKYIKATCRPEAMYPELEPTENETYSIPLLYNTDIVQCT